MEEKQGNDSGYTYRRLIDGSLILSGELEFQAIEKSQVAARAAVERLGAPQDQVPYSEYLIAMRRAGYKNTLANRALASIGLRVGHDLLIEQR